MKKLILFLSAIVVLASCQKKEYATFQKSSTPTYAVAKKQVIATQPATEVAAVVAEENVISQPTEATLVAENTVATSASLTEENVATQPAMVMNEQSINAEFEKLNKLEQYVTSHEGTTLEDVKDTELTKDLKLDTNVTNTVAAGDLPANIPAFWWGCVLSWVGVLIVYLVTDKDKDQTKKALMGCLIGAAIYIVFWLVVGGISFF
ncbi:lipoprotein [Emticicia sp. SJ17W-69]|uniref:lipoprotein n=1 Tax=Emticicia sp. SJ17W-69 TaxID=3421657 RepID=UPI003EB75DDC